MTHIILLDGKLWAFEPQEKPIEDNYPNEHAFRFDLEAYNRAYSLALEQKIEVENWEDVGFVNVTGMFYFWNSGNRERLKENEPIKWEGSLAKVFQYHSSKKHYYDAGWVDCDESQFNSIKKTIPECPLRIVIRLIAPVKEEINAFTGKPMTDAQLIRYYKTKAEAAEWRLQQKCKPVPSEQENQEETLPFEFVEWYSGMSKDKIQRAYEKWLREYRTPAPHMY